jgi:hypothetical protein
MWSEEDAAVGISDEAALARWAEFPVLQSPRPIVFLDERVRVGNEGFVDSEAKLAYLSGAVESMVALPDGVLDTLTDTNWNGPRPDVPALRVESIHSVEASFRTDRGPRPLPAFELHITGMKQRCVFLSTEQQIWWPRTATEWAHRMPGGQATLEPDERILHVQANGGYLTEFLGVEFVESDTAVIAKPLTRERAIDAGTSVPLMLITGEVTGTLTNPLGGRVLIDSNATPYCVTENR